MALSPADYAAYSRATGTPYPEDPEERAQITPDVLEFRRNQLRAPQEESNLPGILGAAALGLSALAGGVGIARALAGKRAQVPPSSRPPVTPQGEQAVQTTSTGGRLRTPEEITRQARTERPRGTVLTDLVNYRVQQNLADIPEPTQQELNKITKSQFNRVYDEITKLPLPRTTVDPNTGREVLLDPFGVDPSSRQAVYASVAAKPESQLPRVYKPQGGVPIELITDPNTGEIFRRGKSPESFSQIYKPLPPGDPWTGEVGAATPLIQGPISAQQNLQNFLGEPTLPYARTDLPTTRTPGSFREFSRDVSGATAAERLAQDPELKQLVTQQRRQEGAELGREAQRQMRIASVIESEADQYIAQLRQEALSQQTLGALESGEDQITGRTMRGVQRNEDLDSSQVNEVFRQTGSADVAAAMTPDGIPVDQTDLWGQPTIPQAQKTVQNPTLLLPAAAASPREKAQEFLQSRFESLGETFPGRYRRERVMGSDPLIAEAAELYAATGDPSVLSRFSKTPSSPLGVKPTVQMSINDEDLPTSQFFKPTGYPEYTGDLIQRDIELTNEISSLGAKQQELLKQAKELGEQELMLRVAMDRDPAGGGAYTNMFGKVKYAQQNLQDPATLDVDLGDALAERNFIRGQINSLENLGTTYKLSDVQEGVRPYFEYDELGRIIPSTFELRSGRKSIDLDPKTGGGRLVSEYDPEGQSGSTRGIYGIEQTSRRSSPTTQPTGMTMDELIREGLEQAQASPEGDVPIPPSLSDLTEQQVTPQKRSSVNMSEAILRAARLQGNRNPRGGVLPDEITMTRRQLKQLDQPEEVVYRPREVIAPGSVPPQQLNLKNVTGYAARRRDTPADIAANQLEAYMSKLQRGRSTPLTSQAVIQPRLF